MSLTREELDAMPEAELRSLWGRVSGSLMRRRNKKGIFRKADSVSARIAALSVGESLLFADWWMSNQFSGEYKTNARIRLEDANANWISRATNQGVRVTRIA